MTFAGRGSLAVRIDDSVAEVASGRGLLPQESEGAESVLT